MEEYATFAQVLRGRTRNMGIGRLIDIARHPSSLLTSKEDVPPRRLYVLLYLASFENPDISKAVAGELKYFAAHSRELSIPHFDRVIELGNNLVWSEKQKDRRVTNSAISSLKHLALVATPEQREKIIEQLHLCFRSAPEEDQELIAEAISHFYTHLSEKNVQLSHHEQELTWNLFNAFAQGDGHIPHKGLQRLDLIMRLTPDFEHQYLDVLYDQFLGHPDSVNTILVEQIADGLHGLARAAAHLRTHDEQEYNRHVKKIEEIIDACSAHESEYVTKKLGWSAEAVGIYLPELKKKCRGIVRDLSERHNDYMDKVLSGGRRHAGEARKEMSGDARGISKDFPDTRP